MRTRWLMMALVLVVMPVLVLAQVDSTAVPAGNADLAFGIAGAARWLAALAGAFMFKEWNVARGAMDTMDNNLKAILGIILVTVLGLVGTWVGVQVSQNPMDWTQGFFQSLGAGVVSTLLVKLGITTVKQKQGVVRRAA